MDTDAIGKLEVELQKMLDAERLSSVPEKLRWLSLNMNEYLERWLGFARMPNLSVAETLDNEVFRVVCAAKNVISRLVESGSSESWCPTEEWRGFCGALEWIYRCPDKNELDFVEATYQTYFARISNVL